MPVTIQTTFRTEALACLAMHGLLTTSQIRSAGTQRRGTDVSAGSCRKMLSRAEKAGLVRGFHRTPGREKTWHLTSSGFESISGIITNPMRMNQTIAAGPLVEHLAVVNALGVGLGESFGPKADVSWSHEDPLPLGSGRYLRPDALLTLLVQEGRQLVGGQWFIEADRGTEAIGILTDKLVNYLTYQAYRPSIPGQRDRAELHWRTRFRAWPPVLFVFDCPRAEQRLERFAAWARDDPRLHPHWKKLPVYAITDLSQVSADMDLIDIPNLAPKPWFS